jgi:hypothetical protein
MKLKKFANFPLCNEGWRKIGLSLQKLGGQSQNSSAKSYRILGFDCVKKN